MADHTPRVIKMKFYPPSAGRIAAVFIGILLIAVLWTSYYTVGAES